MTGTFDTPWGRLRCGSQRRYILVSGYQHSGGVRPVINRRSDKLATLTAQAFSRHVIIDTVTGATVWSRQAVTS
jgi:hypothetical protein